MGNNHSARAAFVLRGLSRELLLTAGGRNSIFLLHGLNGGATKTWQCPDDEPGHTWFRDHLPSLVKDEIRGTNARIWTFGYNASVFSSVSSSLDLGDFVRSLLESVRQVRVGFEVIDTRRLDIRHA